MRDIYVGVSMALVRLLGPVDVIDDDGVMHAPASPLRRTLLALLGVERGRVVTSHQLLDRAWNGDPPESGLRALRFHISKLRAELDIDDLIVTVGSGYRLDVDTDVGLMDAAVDVPVQQLESILSAWRGEPFQDVSPCVVLERERQRLDQRHLAITEAYHRRRVDGGDVGGVADIELLCVSHPVRESLWALLARAHYVAGDQAEALRTIARLRVNLREELGVDPSPEITGLEYQILDHDLRIVSATPTATSTTDTHGTVPDARSEPTGRRVRYARSGDLNIAFEVVSEGPPDIVCVDGFVSHRDFDWEFPMSRQNNEHMMAMGRVILFDKRGTGLSERDLGYGTLEDRMDDLRAVMDAAGCERASFIGVSEGGPLSMMFAATYPDRVDRLVLYGSLTCARKHPDFPWGLTDEEFCERMELVERHWGSGRVMASAIGSDDEHLVEILGRYERSAASPAMVRRIMEANFEIDARPMLPAIVVPTLVIHHVDDQTLPVESARWTAGQIQGARLVEIAGHGSAHLSDDAEVWDRIHEFITGEQRRVGIDRVLATVLFTDVVRSVPRAAESGDTDWASLLDRRHATAEHCVERYRGRVVEHHGDEMFAVFDGPARGIQCAQAIIDEVAPLGVEMRAGLHTGECEVRGDDYTGMTVHIGKRVAALAGAGEVTVSSTVRDLVIGADLEFANHRTVELEGAPGEWTVLTVA